MHFLLYSVLGGGGGVEEEGEGRGREGGGSLRTDLVGRQVHVLHLYQEC